MQAEIAGDALTLRYTTVLVTLQASLQALFGNAAGLFFVLLADCLRCLVWLPNEVHGCLGFEPLRGQALALRLRHAVKAV